jgi:hypothetical protein
MIAIIKRFYWLNVYPFICRLNKQNRIESLIKKYGGSKLSLQKLKKIKSSDTIFILGTGQSINNFTKVEWDEISKANSIGINDFCLKDFAPTFYSFELERQNLEDHLTRWERNASYIIKNEIFEQSIFLLRPYEPTTKILKEFVNYLDSRNLFMWHRIDELPGTSVESIAEFQNRYVENGLSTSNYYFPSRGSSLSWILYLVYKLGYKNIILCGIDLHGDHFWMNSKNISNINFDKKHETAIGSNGIGIKELIYCYKNSILKNTNLFVSTKYSLLSEDLPVYFKNL